MTYTDKIKEESREKFGQFYVSVDDKTNAIRIVDLEGGIHVNGEDGSKIRCIASGDIEKYWLSKHNTLLDEIKEKIQGRSNRIPPSVLTDLLEFIETKR